MNNDLKFIGDDKGVVNLMEIAYFMENEKGIYSF